MTPPPGKPQARRATTATRQSKGSLEKVLAENEALREEVRRVERRIPKAGERGQVRSAYSIALQRLGLPNPDKLRVEDYEKMLEDPQVQAGSTIVKLAILAKTGRINYHPHDENDPTEKELGERIVKYLEWQKDTIRANPGDWLQVLENILSAFDNGFSVNELVWASRLNPFTGQPELVTCPHPDFQGLLYLERAKLLPASSIQDNGIAADPYGNLTALYQNLTRAHIDAASSIVGVPQSQSKDPSPHRISFTDPADLDRLVLFTPRPGAGNLYGTSELKAAYEHWFAKRWNHSARNVLLERLSGNVLLTPGHANQTDALVTAGNNMGVGGVTVLPEGASVDMLKGWEQAVNGFHEALRYDDIMILRALLVPNETVGGADQSQGSWARANSHFNSFLMGIMHRRTKLEEVVETQILQRVVEANWGRIKGRVTFDFDELEEEDREKLARIYAAAISMNVADPSIDAAEIRRELGLKPAPANHVFQRPQPSPQDAGVLPSRPDGQPAMGPQDISPAAPSADAAKVRASEPRRLRWELVDSQAQNQATAEYLEALARMSLAEAFLGLQEMVQADLPKDSSPAELERLVVPVDKVRSALDNLAMRVLWRTHQDMARRWRDLGKQEVGDKLASAVATLAQLRAAQTDDLTGKDPEFVLQSYLASFAAKNQEEAARIALDLQHRLRRRVVQDFLRGFTIQEVARGLADEFTGYTQKQIETVATTGVMDYFNSARHAAYEAAGDYVRGIKFSPLMDAATTPFCRSIQGRSIAKTDPLYERMSKLPFWFRCRTISIPVLADEQGHVFDTDWATWYEKHRGVEGGGFLYA